MRVLSLQKKLTIFITAIIIAALTVVLFVIIPTMRHIINFKTGMAETEKMLESQYQNSQEIKDSLRKLKEVMAQTDIYKKALLKRGDELSVITTLENLAENNQVNQKMDVRLVERANDPEIAKPYYEFTLNSQGDFENLLRYLRALEGMPYYLTINNLHWEANQADSGGRRPITLKFNGIIYVSD